MNPRSLTLATVVVAILALAAVLVIPRLTSGGTPATPASSSAAALNYQDQPVIGNGAAPVTIALFEDFLCPHCAEFSDQVWPRIKRAYIDTGKARAVYFYFPVIDQVQSRVIGGLGQCIYRQSNDDFWKLEQILMRSQQQLMNTARAIDIAVRYAPDLNKQLLTQCVDNGTGAKIVDKDNSIARALRLQGTPTVLVNGKQVSNAAWDTVKKAIDAALSSSSGG